METRDTSMLKPMTVPSFFAPLTSIKIAFVIFPLGTRTKRKRGPEEASNLARTVAAGDCCTSAAKKDMDTVLSVPLYMGVNLRSWWKRALPGWLFFFCPFFFFAREKNVARHTLKYYTNPKHT